MKSYRTTLFPIIKPERKAIYLTEFIFLVVSIIYYNKMLFDLFSSSPLEVAFYKTYSVGFPTTYLAIWGYIDFYLRLHAYSALFFQKIVSLFLLLNGSYLLTKLLYSKGRDCSTTNRYDFLYTTILSLLLTFNPLFVFLYPIFGVSYLAFMNFSLFFSIAILINGGSKVKIITYLLAASFFLVYGVELLPLILAFYLALYLFIGLPLAIYGHKKAMFFYIAFSELLILALTYPSITGLITASKGSGTTFSSISTFHVTNLIFYVSSMFSPETSNTLYSISGLNSIYFSRLLLPAAVLILLLIAITLFFTKDNLHGKLKNIFISLMIVEVLNFTINGYSLVSYLVENLVKDHILRYNHFGIILTVFAGNALILILYWYLLFSVITIHFAENHENPYKLKNGAGKLLKQLRCLSKSYQIGIIIIILIIFFQIGSSTTISLNNSPSWNYVKSSEARDYNQYLLFQNSTYFGNSYVYPPSYEMEPTANKFSFNQAVVNSENSPFLNQIDKSFPASTILLGNSSHSQYINNATPLGNEYAMNNFNGSNVVSGSPIFVVGSVSSYTSLISDMAANIIPNSSEKLKIESIPYGMNVTAIQAYDISLLNAGDYLSFSFNTSISNNNVTPNIGGFNFGIDSNSSARGGYGVGNNFTGIGVNYGNQQFSSTFSSNSGFQQNSTGWTIDSAWTNSSVWNIPLEFTKVGRNLSLNFTIIEKKISSVYYLYIEIGGKWYTLSSHNLFPREYLSMFNYNEPTQNISMAVNVSAFTLNENSPKFVPVFYDSPFTSGSALTDALNSSLFIVFGRNYDVQDLLFSYLVLHKGVKITEPSAYAVDPPRNGWFQTFSSNSPQGAYYSENINPFLLPINIGYGPSVGYAEDVLAGSSLSVPLGNEITRGDSVGINLLFSAMGGPLKIVLGNDTYMLNTFSPNGSYYKWVTLNASGKVSSMEFINLYGVQSVNLIATLPDSILTSAESTINTILATKNKVSTGERMTLNYSVDYANITGIFDSNNEINSISVNNIHSPTLLILPTHYPSGFSASTSNATSIEVPVWGYFSGLLLLNNSRATVNIKLTNNTFYSGIIVYTSPILVAATVLVNRYILRRRKKK